MNNRAPFLKGKTAIITGAAGGIGEYLCKKLAEYEMNLVITGRKPETLHAVAEELRASGVQVCECVGDLAQLSFVDDVLAAARDAFGGVQPCLQGAVPRPHAGGAHHGTRP